MSSFQISTVFTGSTFGDLFTAPPPLRSSISHNGCRFTAFTSIHCLLDYHLFFISFTSGPKDLSCTTNQQCYRDYAYISSIKKDLETHKR